MRLLPPYALLSPGQASLSLCLCSTAPERASCPKSPHPPQPSGQQDTGCWDRTGCCLGIRRLRSGPGVAVLPRSSIPNVHPHPTSERASENVPGPPSATSGRMGWLGKRAVQLPGTSSRMSRLPGEHGAGQLGLVCKGPRGGGARAPSQPGWGCSGSQCGPWGALWVAGGSLAQGPGGSAAEPGRMARVVHRPVQGAQSWRYGHLAAPAPSELARMAGPNGPRASGHPSSQVLVWFRPIGRPFACPQRSLPRATCWPQTERPTPRIVRCPGFGSGAGWPWPPECVMLPLPAPPPSLQPT